MFSPGSSPERMDYSEESSFEEVPQHRLARGEQLSQRREYVLQPRRRVSCPPKVGSLDISENPFILGGAPRTVSGVTCGNALGSIQSQMGFLQLDSPPGGVSNPSLCMDQAHSTASDCDTLSTASGASSKSKRSSIASFFSLGSGSTLGGDCRNDSDSDMSAVSDVSTSTVRTAVRAPIASDASAQKSSTKEEERAFPVSTVRSGQPAERRSKCLKCGRIVSFLAVLAVALYAGAITSGTLKGLDFQRECTIPGPDIELLTSDFNQKIFGQHIAIETVSKSLTDFFHPQNNESTIVLSFHGWTGVGKNYVSSVITQDLPSPHVVKFIIPLHFPHEGEEALYKQYIHDWIITNVTQCSINVLVLDEMDKASPALVEGLEQALVWFETHSVVHSKTVILILSNSGGSQINAVALDHVREGYPRELLSRDVVESVLMEERNTDLWYHGLYRSGLINALVPFLPLEKRHVQMCIRSYLQSRNEILSESKVQEIVEEFEYFPATERLFSKAGCKRVPDFTALFVE